MTYTSGSSAYKLDYQRVVVNQNTRVRNQKRARTILMILFVFAICCSICYRYVLIYGQSTEYAKKQTQLREVEAANVRLNMEVERAVDLKKIEDYAINELGMIYPQRHQIVYVTPQVEDKMERTDVAAEKNSGGIFGAISRALEYLK